MPSGVLPLPKWPSYQRQMYGCKLWTIMLHHDYERKTIHVFGILVETRPQRQ